MRTRPAARTANYSGKSPHSRRILCTWRHHWRPRPRCRLLFFFFFFFFFFFLHCLDQARKRSSLAVRAGTGKAQGTAQAVNGVGARHTRGRVCQAGSFFFFFFLIFSVRFVLMGCLLHLAHRCQQERRIRGRSVGNSPSSRS